MNLSHISLKTGGISLSEMLQELNGVIVEWFMLGIYLNITPEALKIIQAHRETEEDHQRNMLIKWSEVDIPTWEKLIHALMMIKKYDVAINIAITHSKLTYHSIFSSIMTMPTKLKPDKHAQWAILCTYSISSITQLLHGRIHLVQICSCPIQTFLLVFL